MKTPGSEGGKRTPPGEGAGDEELSLLGSCLCPCGPVGRAEPLWVGVILSCDPVEGQVVLPSGIFFRIWYISETAAG